MRKVWEFIINEHRITFLQDTNKDGVELEEFDKNHSFKSRIFFNHEDFKELIKNYKRYEKS